MTFYISDISLLQKCHSKNVTALFTHSLYIELYTEGKLLVGYLGTGDILIEFSFFVGIRQAQQTKTYLKVFYLFSILYFYCE